MAAIDTRRRDKFKKRLPRFFQYLVLVIITALIIVPLVIMVFGALKTRGMMFTHPYTPPIPPDWNNFFTVLTNSSFWVLLRNSLVVGLACTSGVLLVCSLAAFVFARMQFRGKDLAFNLLTLGLMFPITVAIMPVYLVIRQLHLIDSLLAVILVQIAFSVSINIIILRGFFLSIPVELQDAASIDGCSAFDFYWRILLPLARPALAAVGALTLIVSWNDLLTPLVLLNSDKFWTLPLGTMQFQGQYSSDMALTSAFVTLTALPAIIFYMFAERQIVTGLTAGALKG
jgi:raffinose/stachyose/melibiose transport system permease protein